jgi:rhomboid protease GluP
MINQMTGKSKKLNPDCTEATPIFQSLHSDAKKRIVIGDLPNDFEAPEGVIPVAVFRKKKVADEFGLAILAMGESYWAFFSAGRYILCTSTTAAEKVGMELLIFSKLRRCKRVKIINAPEHPLKWGSVYAYALILAGFFLLQQHLPALIQTGRADAVAIVGHSEWWRCLTALYLHADGSHLVANILSGGGFALILCKLYGGPVTWALILLAGAIGNACTAAIYYPVDHFSIGASTAVFAGLGILTATGMAMSLRLGKSALGLPSWLLPLLSGLTLLGFLGVGESDNFVRKIDIMAHLNGFIVGILLGFPMAFVREYLLKRERLSWWTGVFVVVGCSYWAWMKAIS